MKLAVIGANGRMGRAVVRIASAANMEVVCAIGNGDAGRDAGELAGIGKLGVAITSDLGALIGDVLVDFSAPAAMPALAAAAAAANVAIVSGTTGLDDRARAALDEAALRVPVLWEPNMSVGVNVLADLVARAVAALGAGYDVDIVETHHRAKVDAPSGTALRLAEVVERIRGGELVTGRSGRPGPRKSDEIGVLAVRGGDVVGDHTVFFFGDGERIELTHRASSRDLFAHGAVRAAGWIRGRAPGRYRLADVLAVPA